MPSLAKGKARVVWCAVVWCAVVARTAHAQIKVADRCCNKGELVKSSNLTLRDFFPVVWRKI